MDNVLVLPSIAAIALKLTFMWAGRGYLGKAPSLVILFLSSILATNVIEFLGFAYFNKNLEYAFFPMVLYYISLITVSFSLLGLTLQVLDFWSKTISRVLIGIWATICVTVFAPGAVVAGVTSLGYALSAIKGPFYAVGPLSCILPLLISTLLLIWSIRKNKKAPCSIILLACISPLLLTEVSVAVIMANKIKLNGTIILSFTSIISVMSLVFYKHVLSFSNSVSRKLSGKDGEILSIARRTLQDSQGLSLKDAVTLFQYQLIKQAIDQAGGDHDKAYELLGDGGSISNQRRYLKKGAALEESLANPETGIRHLVDEDYQPNPTHN